MIQELTAAMRSATSSSASRSDRDSGEIRQATVAVVAQASVVPPALSDAGVFRRT